MAETYDIVVRVTGQNDAGQAMSGLESQLNAIDSRTQQTSRSMAGFGQALQTAVGAFVLNQVRQFADQMMEVGTQVRSASATFEQLSGGSANASSNLERLQQATGGVVDNLTLMQGASRLMSMGIATNADDLSRLTEMAVKLGAAMGNDAQTSIADFGSMLANQSILRLDTFGISSDHVRQRIDELLASGQALSRDQAFRMAVMEEGAISLDRLGSAADVASTATARLQTRWTNLTQALSAGAANIVDQAAGTLEMSAGIIDAISQQNARRAAAQDLLRTLGAAGGTPWFGGTNYPIEMLDALSGRQAYFGNQYGYGQSILDMMNFSAPAGAAMTQADRAALLNQQRGSYMGLADQVSRLMAMYNPTTGSGFFDSSQVQAIDSLFQQIDTTMQSIRDEASAGFVTDEELGRAQSWYDTFKNWRDVVHQGAEALSNIRLDQALGAAGGNPLASDLVSQVLEAARGSDIGAGQLQELTDTLQTYSGEMSQAALVMRETVVPELMQIYQQFGAGATAQAVSGVENFLRQAAVQGLGNTQIAQLLPYATGYSLGGGGASFSVRPGDTVSGIAAATGLSPDQIMAAAGITNPRNLLPGTYGASGGVSPLDPGEFEQIAQSFGFIADNSATASDATTQMADSTTTARDNVDQMSAQLDAISARTYDLNLNLNLNDPAGILRLLLAGGLDLASALQDTVRDNGGTVPGANPRARGGSPVMTR